METKQTGPAKPWAQHAPVGAGCGHVSLPHTVPAPRHTPWQADGEVIVHPPPAVPEAGTQHAPVGIGQSVGVHTEPAPFQTW